MTAFSRAYSQCKGCHKFEWNDRLQENKGCCYHCNRKVKLYVPKTQRGGKGTSPSEPPAAPGPKESDLNTLLQQVVQKSESAALKAV
eukprot:6816976-Pyramimonas_sp.AAC.1